MFTIRTFLIEDFLRTFLHQSITGNSCNKINFEKRDLLDPSEIRQNYFLLPKHTAFHWTLLIDEYAETTEKIGSSIAKTWKCKGLKGGLCRCQLGFQLFSIVRNNQFISTGFNFACAIFGIQVVIHFPTPNWSPRVADVNQNQEEIIH